MSAAIYCGAGPALSGLNSGTSVYCGNHGDYQLPRKFVRLKFKRDGSIDRRQSKADIQAFETWKAGVDRPEGKQ